MPPTRSQDFYLIVRKGRYYALKARITTKLPALAAGEVPIKLKLELPEGLFSRPQLQAKVVVPQNCVSPPVIDATVLDNVREVLEQQTGLDVRVSLVEGA